MTTRIAVATIAPAPEVIPPTPALRGSFSVAAIVQSMGAPPAALYAAVPEMCAWAEEHGGLAAVLCQHHGSEDGYLPSPIIPAPAIAARTQRLAALRSTIFGPKPPPRAVIVDELIQAILHGFLHRQR